MRLLSVVVACVVAVVVSACTPAQIAVLERLQGHPFSPESYAELEALPDYPIRLSDRSVIELDGSITPAPPYSPHEGALCPQWHLLALEAGWLVEDMPRLDVIMWRESRCIPSVLFDNAKTGDYSIGLLQINIRVGAGTRGTIGPMIDFQWHRLYDPYTNLWVGKQLSDHYAAHRWAGYCKWWGWTTKNRGWC